MYQVQAGPSMTTRYQKRHYEDVARILKSDAGHLDRVRNTIIQEFTDLFATDNPLFDRDRFLSACGLEPTPTAGKGTDLHSSHSEWADR